MIPSPCSPLSPAFHLAVRSFMILRVNELSLAHSTGFPAKNHWALIATSLSTIPSTLESTGVIAGATGRRFQFSLGSWS